MASESTRVPVEAGLRVFVDTIWMVWVTPGVSPLIDHTTCAVCCTGAYRSIVTGAPLSTMICALPRSGPRVETTAKLLAVCGFCGLAVAPAVVENWTEPLNAPDRFWPLQLPLKLDWKLLSVSGTLKVGPAANGLSLPVLSTAWTS